MKKKTITGAAMVIGALEQEKVEIVFGYPGGAMLPLYDTLYDAPLRHILVRHEQAAVHAADGYARITGRPGVVFATSGPGATNLVTGIANAYMDSVPMVLITAQVSSHLIGTDAFQEADITGITLPITKHNYLVKDIHELPSVLSEAFFIATTGRCGPVLIDVPKDIFIQESNFQYHIRREIPGYKPTYEGHQGQISRAVKAIRDARKPVIFAGGGVIRSAASQQLIDLAERARIPVILSLMGLGAYPGDRPLFLGMPGMHGSVSANYALTEADLIVAAGVRFDDRVTGKLESFANHAKIVHIDIDPAEIGKNVVIDIPIVGDVRKVLEALLKKLQPGDTADWLEQIEVWQKQFPLSRAGADSTGSLKPQFVIREFSRLGGGDAIVATDVGQHQMWTAQHYCVKKPRSFITSGGLGTMGYGFPAAIGAKFASPDRTVICVTGDGSFQMNIQELATAVCNKLDLTIAIINNGYLGMVRQWQELFCKKRYAYTTLHGNPDFVRVAEAYGAMGIRATTPSEATAAIEKALKEKGPVVIDFVVEPEENVYPMVAPNCPINEIIFGGDKF
ncbi:MAG TPA: biosynthetic-type acetolactate synthase large subunit [Candidatus Limnocylindrales bacterium]|nr:biosynthetic-type acetolactate synthase large subunit [Candidatus Limnocylindrales bacterium]